MLIPTAQLYKSNFKTIIKGRELLGDRCRLGVEEEGGEGNRQETRPAENMREDGARDGSCCCQIRRSGRPHLLLRPSMTLPFVPSLHVSSSVFACYHPL